MPVRGRGVEVSSSENEIMKPCLKLPDGFELRQDRHGRWDVYAPAGSNFKDPDVLATLTRLRAELEQELSPAPTSVPSEQEHQVVDPELEAPWIQQDPDFICCCMGRNVTGDAELFASMHRGKVAINVTTGGDRKSPELLMFEGHHWQLDESSSYAHSLIENVAQAYGYAHSVRTVASFRQRIDDMQNRLLKETNADEQNRLQRDIDSEKKALEERSKGVNKRISSLRSPSREESIIKKARSIAGFPLNCKSSWLDARPHLLPVANGVVELETGRHRPGHPDDWMVRAAPVEWRGANSDRSAWEEFLRGVYMNPETRKPDTELIKFIQRLFGYALLGATPNHILPILTGRGRNGKSTLLNTIYSVLGPLAGSLPSELLLDQGMSRSADAPTPSVMMLKGLRVGFASETAQGRKFSIERVKWLTGGDPLTGRWGNDKYPTTFNPTHLLFLLTNNLPTAPPTDYAFWKRVLAIPHKVSFVHGDPAQDFEMQIDPDLEARLADCRPGILAWLVEGHLAWRKYGLAPPAIVSEATDKYREGEDILGEFLFECCEIGNHMRIGASKLYNVFEGWHQDHVGKFVPAQKTFGGWMNDKGFERIKSGTIKYEGVTLKVEHAEGAYVSQE